MGYGHADNISALPEKRPVWNGRRIIIVSDLGLDRPIVFVRRGVNDYFPVLLADINWVTVGPEPEAPTATAPQAGVRPRKQAQG